MHVGRRMKWFFFLLCVALLGFGYFNRSRLWDQWQAITTETAENIEVTQAERTSLRSKDIVQRQILSLWDEKAFLDEDFEPESILWAEGDLEWLLSFLKEVPSNDDARRDHHLMVDALFSGLLLSEQELVETWLSEGLASIVQSRGYDERTRNIATEHLVKWWYPDDINREVEPDRKEILAIQSSLVSTMLVPTNDKSSTRGVLLERLVEATTTQNDTEALAAQLRSSLEKLIGSPDFYLRDAAIRSAVPLKATNVVYQLEHIIQDATYDENTSLQAIHALGELGDKSSREILNTTKLSQNPSLRSAILVALRKFAHEHSVTTK